MGPAEIGIMCCCGDPAKISELEINNYNVCQMSPFHQQSCLRKKIICICLFCAWGFFSTLLP